MKKSIVFFLTALLLSFGTVGLCQQETPEVELDREAAIKAFAQLTESAMSSLKSDDAATKATTTGKFSAIAPVGVPPIGVDPVVGSISYNNAVRVWFELSDGRYVNPRTYRWAPNEVFYVHVQSAVPVYVVLYQNFASGLPSKRVYPDARFPESYRMLMPGVDTRLPVAFQMAPNFLPERMSMVVTRADWDGIRAEVPQASAVAVAVATAGDEQAVATAYAGVLKSGGSAEIKSEQALAKFAAINSAGVDNAEYQIDGTKFRVRCHVSYPRYVQPVHYVRYVNRSTTYVNVTNVTNINYIQHRGCYDRIDDVAFYLFADNGVGQWQVTLNKVGGNWRWNW